jgi:hypothetical protein
MGLYLSYAELRKSCREICPLVKYRNTTQLILFVTPELIGCINKNLRCVTLNDLNIFQYISNKMQLYTVYLYLETALNV